MNAEAPSRIAVIGGGLAGTSCAFVLAALGAKAVIFERGHSIADGASGNPETLVNPRLSATRTPESDFYAGAFALTARTLARLGGCGFRRHGSLHLATTEDLRKRYPRTVENWGWPRESMAYVDAHRASELAGVSVRHPALWLPDAGSVSTAKLCARYARECEVRLGLSDIALERQGESWSVSGESFDAVILACGMNVRDFAPAAWLPLYPVSGQIARVEASENTRRIRCALCYGGTIAPESEGVHIVGSTFRKGEDDTALRPRDEEKILETLQEALPDLANGFSSLGGWAGVRAVAQDRVPIAGSLPDVESWEAGGAGNLPGLYVTTAHGAHGVVSTLAAAHHLAGMILGLPASLPRPVAALLSPARFLRRERRRKGS